MNPIRRYSTPKFNWDSTLNLPKTGMSMRSTLNDEEFREAVADKLYEKLASRTAPEFNLIDGPPFANGDLHVGHALNKILKDTILRVKGQHKRHRIVFRPGWDCHGLPIELKALQKASEQSQNLNPIEIRSLCRKFALEAIQSQKASMQKWGILADYRHPVLTMDPEFEANELIALATMVEKDLIYSAKKPVFYSPSSQTALAEAELEYSDDHVSLTALVKFKAHLSDFVQSRIPGKIKGNVQFVTWTTTPWTLPSNKALAVGKDIVYSLLYCSVTSEHFIIAKSRIAAICTSLQHTLDTIISDFCKGSELATCQYEPLRFSHSQPASLSPVLVADFVTDESGSGLVHLAPDYGTDDYNLCRSVGIEPNSVDFLDEQGEFTADAPSFLKGTSIFSGASESILEYLKCTGNFLSSNYYTHRYPYDWRTKKPVIQRATRQWFASISSILPQLENALEGVKFIPESGKDKMLAMLRGRADWCISRQRHWGLPIPAIQSINNKNQVILDSRVIRHVASLIRSDPTGSDIWWNRPIKDLLPDSNFESFEKTFDTLDGWFDSGTVWTNYPSLTADLYLEGSDQYRGWFQSSFINSVAVTGKAPFKTVITHGFVLDQKGQKMSKSIGNVIDPNEIVKLYGSDVLRLWVASVNCKSDVNIGPEIIKQVAENKRKIRNTFRFLLGNLYSFKPNSRKEFRWIDDAMIMRTEAFRGICKKLYDAYDFPAIVQQICNFCTQDLSAFYFEILKDRLYIESIDSPGRQAGQAVLFRILQVLHEIASPLVPFLSEEVRSHLLLLQQQQELFHVQSIPLLPRSSGNEFNWIQKERANFLEWFNATGKTELNVKSTFQVDLTLSIPKDYFNVLTSKDLEEIFMVAKVNLSHDSDTKIVSVKVSDRQKCPRCWTFNSLDAGEPCPRCISAIEQCKVIEKC